MSVSEHDHGSGDERRFPVEARHRLLDERLYRRWDPPGFLERLTLEPGETVADLGCGPGFWTLPLAEAVGPDGRVYAIDASAEMLRTLGERRPPPWVTPRQAELPDTGLPDASVDVAWLASAYHEVPDGRRLAAELRRIVRPGGRVLVLEWRPDGVSESGPPRSHRLQPDDVMAWLREAGFAGARVAWQDDDNYLVEAS